MRNRGLRRQLENRLNSTNLIRLLVILMIVSAFPTSVVHGAETVKPPRARQENPENLTGHGGPVTTVVSDQAGRHVLTGSFDYSVILWSVSSSPPEILMRASSHDGAINAAAFVGTDNRFISAGDDGSIYYWDGNTQKLLHRFGGHDGKVVSVTISRDQKYVASASWDRSVRIWNLGTLMPGVVLKGHRGPVNDVLFSQDGKFVYSASYDGSIRKWDSKTGKELLVLHKHGWGINVMAWLPGDRQIMFGSSNGDVHIVDTSTGEITKILIPHQRPVLALAVSKDGQLAASGGGDGVIRVWQLADWSVAEEFNSFSGPVWSMDFGANNRNIYYAGLDDFVVSWKHSPREVKTETPSKYPRRFQKVTDMSLGERQFFRKCSKIGRAHV